MHRRTIPRLFELKDFADSAESAKAYFQDFDQRLSLCPEMLRQFTTRERYLVPLDNASCDALKKRVSSYLSARDPDRGWQHLFEHLNEALAYCYIKDLGAERISFVPEQPGNLMLDLTAHLGTGRLLCEVKAINISALEVERRAKSGVGETKAVLARDFLTKLCKTIAVAADQLLENSYDANDHLVAHVVVNYDDWLHEYAEEYPAQIDEFLGPKSSPCVDVEIADNRL